MGCINAKIGEEGEEQQKKKKKKKRKVLERETVVSSIGGKRQNRIVRLWGWRSRPPAQLYTNMPNRTNNANYTHSSRIFPPFRFCSSFAPNFNLTSSSSPTHVHLLFPLVRSTQSLP